MGALNVFTSKREEREDFYVDELTDYALSKEFKTYGIKVFKNLLDSLNKTKRSEAKFALLVELEGDFIEISYFKKEIDANYTLRKFKKITRLAFREALALSVAPLKEIA